LYHASGRAIATTAAMPTAMKRMVVGLSTRG
jgi:hypothetical protein